MTHTFWKLVNVIMASSLTGSPDLFPSSKNQSFWSSSLSTSSRDFRWRKTARASSRSFSFFDFTMIHSLWEPHIIWVINLETITLSFHFLWVMLDKNSGWFEMKNVSFLIRLSMLKTFSLQSYAHNLRLNKIFSAELFSRRSRKTIKSQNGSWEIGIGL